MIKYCFRSLLFGLFLVVSCSTAKQMDTTNIIKSNTITMDNKLINFEISTNLTVNIRNSSNSASAKIKVAGIDSLALSLYGPFGISVAKVFSDKNQLIFFNLLTNQIFKGNPSEENMKTAMMLPISFSDFIHLIRCEIPNKKENYIFDKKLDEFESLFKNEKDSNYIEYAVISDTTHELTQYQRKALDGTLILHVFYSDYKIFDSVYFSTKQIYKFPSINADLSLEVSDFKTVTSFDSPFKIKIPEGIEVIDLEQR